MYKTKKTKDDIDYHFYLHGINFGYPECCTHEFVKNIGNKTSYKREVCFIAAGILDLYHVINILVKFSIMKFKINDLISNRICFV